MCMSSSRRHFDRNEEHRNQAAVLLPELWFASSRDERCELRRSSRSGSNGCAHHNPHHCSLETAGRLLAGERERYLRSAGEMEELFRDLRRPSLTHKSFLHGFLTRCVIWGITFPIIPFPKATRCSRFSKNVSRKACAGASLQKRKPKLFEKAKQQARSGNWS